MEYEKKAERLHDLVLDGVAHELGVVPQVELIQNSRAIGTDRGRPEAQAIGDFRDGLA